MYGFPGFTIDNALPLKSVKTPAICEMSSVLPGLPSGPAVTFGSVGIGVVTNDSGLQMLTMAFPCLRVQGLLPGVGSVRSKLVR